ncbi:MAG TPA: hypothetical protein G4O02_10175 [Caldilineae bacterium]|nr:hypothetical protein [Caldilineae bacterium]
MTHRSPPWGALVRLSAISIALVGVLTALALLNWQARPQTPYFVDHPLGYAEIGVNVALEQYDAEALASTLDRLRAADVRWLRQRFPWDQIEPTPGRFEWATWDRIVRAASERGFRMIAVLDGSPAWARRPEDAENPLAPPRERADFGRFVAAFVERYGDRLDVYQIWDEPNIAPHWGARPIDPLDYLGLLREGYYQIKARDPHALVLLAALAPNDEPGGANMSDLAFLDRLYALGGRAWFDVVAAQPYGFDSGPDASDGFGRAAALRAVMERHGDGTTPVWAVSFGWNALPDDWRGRPSIWGQVDEATQAAYLREAVRRARREWAWMGPMLWATLQPALPVDDPYWGFALWSPDGTPRLAWDALIEMTAPPAVVGLGVYRPNHPALRYEGDWRVTPEAADIGRTGDRLVIPFWGRGIALQIRRGPYWAYLTVTIDGQPAPALPRDPDGRAYLVLYGPEPRSDIVDLAVDLPLAEHEAVIEATGGWGQWALERVIVRGDAPPRWLWIRHVLGVLALSLGGAALWSLRRGDGPAALAALRALSHRLDGWAARVPEWVQAAVALSLGLIVVLAPFSGLRLIAFAALAIALWFRLDLLPPLILLYLPFHLRAVPLEGRAFSVPELGILLGTGILIARQIMREGTGRERARFFRGPLDDLVAAFVGIAILATLAAEERDVAWRELRTVIIEPALFYLILTRGAGAVGRRLSPWPTVDAFIVGAVLASVIGLGQYTTGAGVIEAEGVRRVRALYGSPNNLALYLDRAIPMALAVAMLGQGWRRRFYAPAVILILAACLLTFSKGAWLLGLPLSIVTLIGLRMWMARGIRREGRRPELVGLGVLALIGLALVPFLRTPRFAHLLDFTSGTGFFRLRLWQSAWRMVLDHPWLGVGPDNFLYQYRSRYVLPDAWAELNLSHPHNIVLDLWTRLGLGGLVIGGWLFVRAAIMGVQLLRDGREETYPLVMGILAALTAVVAHGLIDNSIFLVDLGFVWMMMLGLLTILWSGRPISPKPAG